MKEVTLKKIMLTVFFCVVCFRNLFAFDFDPKEEKKYLVSSAIHSRFLCTESNQNENFPQITDVSDSESTDSKPSPSPTEEKEKPSN